MDIDISELSFAFALLDEFKEALSGKAVVTSLGSGLFDWPALDGSDVKPGIAIFLHFKRPEYMVMATASQWARYKKPYFRVSIPRRKRSNIHRILHSISELEPAVYYVIPMFHTQQEVDRLYVMRTIMNSTSFVPLSLLPPAGDGEHHITGSRGDDLRLDGSPLKGSFTAEVAVDGILDALGDDQRVSLINKGYLQRMYRMLYATVFPDSTVKVPEDSSEIARDISKFMRIYLGGEALIVMRK